MKVQTTVNISQGAIALNSLDYLEELKDNNKKYRSYIEGTLNFRTLKIVDVINLIVTMTTSFTYFVNQFDNQEFYSEEELFRELFSPSKFYDDWELFILSNSKTLVITPKRLNQLFGLMRYYYGSEDKLFKLYHSWELLSI